MTEKKHKIVFTGKPLTPFMETAVLGAFIFIVIISIKEYFRANDPNYIWLIFVGLAAFIRNYFGWINK